MFGKKKRAKFFVVKVSNILFNSTDSENWSNFITEQVKNEKIFQDLWLLSKSEMIRIGLTYNPFTENFELLRWWCLFGSFWII
jgi:hypothetical protein